MHLNPYGEYAVLLAVDLVSTPPRYDRELQERCEAGGLNVDSSARPRDVDHVNSFLQEWLLVVDAPTDDLRAAELNKLLFTSSAHPRLTNHANDGWHLHYREFDQSLGDQVQALISVGTALHLIGRGMHRLARCALPECPRPFADVTRNGRQRYCSHPCANRDAVRRHRAKVG